jgi:hypothetical protein
MIMKYGFDGAGQSAGFDDVHEVTASARGVPANAASATPAAASHRAAE